jgi:hypothetical protein
MFSLHIIKHVVLLNSTVFCVVMVCSFERAQYITSIFSVEEEDKQRNQKKQVATSLLHCVVHSVTISYSS